MALQLLSLERTSATCKGQKVHKCADGKCIKLRHQPAPFEEARMSRKEHTQGAVPKVHECYATVRERV
eukprot:1146574-Pelagomonas_calceolata.AAC.8